MSHGSAVPLLRRPFENSPAPLPRQPDSQRMQTRELATDDDETWVGKNSELPCTIPTRFTDLQLSTSETLQTTMRLQGSYHCAEQVADDGIASRCCSCERSRISSSWSNGGISEFRRKTSQVSCIFCFSCSTCQSLQTRGQGQRITRTAYLAQLR